MFRLQLQIQQIDRPRLEEVLGRRRLQTTEATIREEVLETVVLATQDPLQVAIVQEVGAVHHLQAVEAVHHLQVEEVVK